ncbi:MAG: DUF87 domain-containing protein [Candidatus Lokiarchaeota archaeon]|nr:DUF87 domain-containing protein [Candidatus Lokiarchaeota archaeon]
MSADQKPIVAKISGRVTLMGFTVRALKPLSRTDYLAIEKGGKTYVLGIQRIWRDKNALFARLNIVGQVPNTPFESNEKIYIAEEEDIKQALKIDVPEERSMNLGALIGTNIEATFTIDKLGRLFVTGRSGSGKSHTVGVIVEELIKKQIPIVIIDRHGEYSSLKVIKDDIDLPDCDFFNIEEPKHAFSQYIVEFGEENMNPGVDLGLDYLYASQPQDLVAKGQCTIINLRGLSLETQRETVDWLLNKLYKASTKREISPFFLFIDEAHELAGKRQTEVADTVRLIAQEGRKFGMNLVVITQRPQALNVTLRAQAGTWIIHKLTDVNDVKITCKSAEGLSSKEDDELIQMLDVGEAIIVGEISPKSPVQVKIRQRYTVHGGAGYNILDYVKKDEDLHKSEMIKHLKNRIGKEDLERIKTAKGLGINPEELPKDYVKLKEKVEQLEMQKAQADTEIEDLKEQNSDLKAELKAWKIDFKQEKKRADDAVKVAEKLLKEIKKRK